jgi:hypothetical protein
VADTEQKQAPASFVPPSQVSPNDLMKAFQDEGIVEKPAEPAPAAGKTGTEPATIPAPVATQKTEELPALLKIAKERDAFRKEVEPLKPYMEALKVLSPTEAQRLAQARQSGDPVAALAALGFTHQQYTQKLLSLPPTPEEGQKAEAPEPTSEIQVIKQELAALKAEREQAQIQQSRAGLLAQMKNIVKDNPKFDLINKTEDVEGIERVLLQYHTQHGTLPGSTMEESVLLAAEMYESHLKKEADRWQKVLTGFKESAPVSATKAPEPPPSAGTVQTRTLTNANTTAPAAVRTVPKTREEIIAAIIEGRDEDLV